MVGAKIPVLEIEKLRISDDGRGIIVYNDGTNFLKSSWAYGEGGTNKSGTANAWLKVHMVSSSTYGTTGATYYVPCYTTLQ